MQKLRALLRRSKDYTNVLFLVLLAIILLVALSYAVLGLGQENAARQRAATPSAGNALMHYSSALRTGVTRLLLRDVPLGEIDFSPAVTDGSDPARMVFHPEGGGVTFTPLGPAAVTALQDDAESFGRLRNGNWHFVRLAIGNIGTAAPELVAVLQGVTEAVCRDINPQATGIHRIPELSVTTADILSGAAVLTDAAVADQPFLCVRTRDGLLYYHVLAEQ